jgi:hypothetical protein
LAVSLVYLKRFQSFILDGTGGKWLFNVVEVYRPIVFEALVMGVMSKPLFAFCIYSPKHTLTRGGKKQKKEMGWSE